MSFGKRTVTYGLIAGLAVSLLFNLISYTYIQNLNQQMSFYKDAIGKQSNAPAGVSNGVKVKTATSAVYTKLSITAVAVKQILEDNFF